MTDLDFKASCEKARQSRAEGDSREALRLVRQLLASADQLEGRAEWQEGFALLAEVSRDFGGESSAARASAVAKDPDNVEALYNLGYDLIEIGLPQVAATVLQRANQLLPGQPRLLLELVAALEQQMRYQEAANWLRLSPHLLETQFDCRYLLAFNSLMSGDLATPQQLLAGLQAKASGQRQRYMVNTIEGMLYRAEAIRGATFLSEADLRGWHFVSTGGILLHCSPYGEEVMHGRYAFIQDNENLQREILERLKVVLQTWEISFPRVFMLPDRESAILARAASQLLGCPLESWPSEGTSRPGLIVSYALERLETKLLNTFFEHRAGQILWDHASCWTKYQDCSGDLVSYLHQFNHSPWQAGRLKVNSGTGKMEEEPASQEPEEMLAQQLLNTPLDYSVLKDLPALVTLAKAIRAVPERYAAGAFNVSGRRRPQWPGSAVPSNRFE